MKERVAASKARGRRAAGESKSTRQATSDEVVVVEEEVLKRGRRGRPKKPSVEDQDQQLEDMPVDSEDEDTEGLRLAKIQALYTMLRQNGERVAGLREVELKRQHEVNRTRWTTRVEVLESELASRDQALAVSLIEYQ